MRPELIHPMLVHFPIALLCTGVVVRFVALFTAKRPILSFLLPASWMILFLGVVAAWSAIIAGEIAREIVEPMLRNVGVLDEHEEHAYMTAYVFTFGLFIDWTRAFLLAKLYKRGWIVKRGLAAVIWLLYLFSLTNLIITGFYGGTLVYEEGAAVSTSGKGRFFY
jgi:uncharacterized membrane protein